MDLGLPPHADEPTEGFRLLQDILAMRPVVVHPQSGNGQDDIALVQAAGGIAPRKRSGERGVVVVSVSAMTAIFSAPPGERRGS